MQSHNDRMRRIKDLSEQLSAALDVSYRVRERAEALREAIDELVRSVPPERRNMPRVKTPVQVTVEDHHAESTRKRR
jgi:hypothetical protein